MSNNSLQITVISAGAGSGKTYTLTGRMIDMLSKGVRPSAIIATTFTKKAAAELQERVRARLLEQGQSEAANELGSALIGTVHSIGVKLLQRFAFEAGVSPLVEIIADGDEQRLFNESLAQILTNDRTDRMNQLADRLGLSKKGYSNEPYDWRKPIRDLTDVARANNFSKEVLEKSRVNSWESFRAMLPPVSTTDLVTLNNRLISAMQQTVAALENNEADTTAVTKDAIALLRQIENDLKWRGELYWYEWIRVAKLKTGAKSRHLVEDLQEVAQQHLASPDFQGDIKAFIDLVFDIAGNALSEYERYKQKRGLIDYTDMETYISRLLRVPSVRETLRNELDLLLVDEFQDTSPIQLDIFLQLSQIAQHSIWVGDPKQSIYGFRGAEPALMQAIIEATGGIKPDNILEKSWRSRADIVEAVNAIFVRAFDKMPPEQVVLQPNFTYEKDQKCFKELAPDALDNYSALVHWHFINQTDEKKATKDWLNQCIAEQIRVLLERKTLVFDKSRQRLRPVQPGDIAVLCRNNKECESVAEALHRSGLKAGISRAGLLDTPEIKLILAWLRRLVNPNDRLSAAEIKLISGATTLERLLADITSAAPDKKWQSLELTPPGTDLHTRSAAEALDLLIAELDIRRSAVYLGNAVQRLDNIEVLRRYAVEYESACNRLHTAATIGGFLLWLGHLSDNKKDYQGSGESPDTVNVLTYHKSKGLEYPVCICHSLDAPLKEQIWGINLVPEQAPDLNDILSGRWLRFWVNPYADGFKNTWLEEQIQQSEAFAAATAQALAEEARLLYVGLTRARDYLVFPTTKKGTSWLNRVFAQGNPNATVLDPDSPETPFFAADGRVIHAHIEHIYQPTDIGFTFPQEHDFPFFAPYAGKQLQEKYQIAPGQEAAPGGKVFQVAQTYSLYPALDLTEEQMPPTEKALMTLCSSAYPLRPDQATEQVRIRRIDAVPAAMLEQCVQSVWEAIQRQWGNGVPVAHAVPLRWYTQGRLLEYSLDMVVQISAREWAVVLFVPKNKTAANAIGPTVGWLQRALEALYPDVEVQFWGLSVLEGNLLLYKA
jgi:ATP-dependent helicase/nuclease subunit A